MRFDSVDAEIQEIGDVFVGFAFGDELKDFALARCEQVVGVFGAAAFELANIIIEEDLADRGAEKRLAFSDGANGFDEIGFGGIFKQVALGAGFQGAQDVAFIGMHAEHDHENIWIGLRDLKGGFDAVEIGHADVHDDYVGLERFCKRDGFAAVAGLADDGEIGLLLDEQTETAADELVIIGEKNANFSHGWFTGIRRDGAAVLR